MQQIITNKKVIKWDYKRIILTVVFVVLISYMTVSSINDSKEIAELKKNLLSLEVENATATLVSEIEEVKTRYDNMDSNIEYNKSLWSKSIEETAKLKEYYEESVWEKRCISKKLLDLSVDCTWDLTEYATRGL